MPHGAAQVTLKTRMITTRVRTGGCARNQRSPLADRLCGALGINLTAVGTGVRAIREMSTTASETHRICARNGQNVPAANRNAPSGGPAN